MDRIRFMVSKFGFVCFTLSQIKLNLTARTRKTYIQSLRLFCPSFHLPMTLNGMYLFAQQMFSIPLHAMRNKFSGNCFLVLNAQWTFAWRSIEKLAMSGLAKLQVADWLFNMSFEIEILTCCLTKISSAGNLFFFFSPINLILSC